MLDSLDSLDIARLRPIGLSPVQLQHLARQDIDDPGDHAQLMRITEVQRDARQLLGGDAVVAHAGDSRAYLVRGGIAMQLTEDHTLLARLMAAGMPVDRVDESHRWKGVITNALGIGDETKVVTFLVPLSDGDRLLLCSDGISEYVHEAEVGEVLCSQPSPARAAQRLVELAIDRGGEDNATALVIKVLEVGATPIPAEQRKRDDLALARCPLLAPLSPQQRLRALRVSNWSPAISN